MEFNYLLEQNVLAAANGRYSVDFARMPAALEQLTRELLQQEATGNRARAESWFRKYGTVPAELKNALAATSAIPVDIYPAFSFPDKVE